MPLYANFLRLIGYPDTQQIEHYRGQVKLHAAALDAEGQMKVLAKDLAECYEGKNEGSIYCLKVKSDYDKLYQKHYGKVLTAPEAPPTPVSDIAMMHKYSARIDTHREEWSSASRIFNSEKKRDEERMWNLADALFDCHACHYADSAGCTNLKQEYDALYEKHHG